MRFTALSTPLFIVTSIIVLAILMVTTTLLPSNKALLIQNVERFDIPSNARIVTVTNLNADGPGSFTDAMLQTGPRVIVFEVGGVIDLRSKSAQRLTQMISLKNGNGNVVVAGETAPSPGIHLIGAPLEILTSNVVIRHLSIYTGTQFPYYLSSDALKIDSFGGNNIRNILIENNTFLWAIDETGELWTDPLNYDVGRIKDIIFRKNIFGEALLAANQGTGNPEGALHPKGPHSNGFLLSHGAQQITFERNIFASNYRRNPWITGNTTSFFLNNLIFNPDRHAFIFSGGNVYGDPPKDVLSAQVTAVGNVAFAGQDTQDWLMGDTDGQPKMFFGAPDSVGRNTKLYLDDNAFFARNGSLIGKDWGVVYDSNENSEFALQGSETPMTWYPLSSYSVLPSSQVKTTVLNEAGARPFDSNRPHTSRLINAMKDGTSRIVNVEADVGGYPVLTKTTRAFTIATLDPIPAGYLALSTIGTSQGLTSSIFNTSSSQSSLPTTATVTLPTPVGQWLMNSTTLLPDVSNHGNTLTLMGSVPKVTADTQYAASFTGNINNYLFANPSSTINMNGNSFTISAWFKPTDVTSGIRGIVSKSKMGRFGDAPIQIYHENDVVRMSIGDSTIQTSGDPYFLGKTRADNIFSPAHIEAGRWNHVLAWYDATEDVMGISVNGETPTVKPTPYTRGYDFFTDTTPFNIGKMYSQAPFNGLLSHIEMWRTILTPEQRKKLFQENVHCTAGTLDCTLSSMIISPDEEGFYAYGFEKTTTPAFRGVTKDRDVPSLLVTPVKKGIWLLKDAEAGTYDVFTTWTQTPTRTQNVPLRIVVPGEQLAPIATTINQANAPRIDSSFGNGKWQKIGSVTLLNRGSIRVELSPGTSSTNARTTLDSVLFQKKTILQ